MAPNTTPAINGHGMTLIVDMSEYEPDPNVATLLLVCKGCRQVFISDYEEERCAECVARRER